MIDNVNPYYHNNYDHSVLIDFIIVISFLMIH